MKTIEFWKMNGSGNDFILIDNRDGKVTEEEMGHLVERICRRRESVGADGLIFITNSDRYDFAWRYFNADGGEVEMCGNGGRCVARYAYLKDIAGSKMTFETMAGPVSAEVMGRIVKVLKRAVILVPGDYVNEKELPLSITQSYSQENGSVELRSDITQSQSLEELEKEAIMVALEGTGGNKSETARKLGINRRTLYNKLQKFGVI